METEFDFNKTSNEYSCNINSNTILHINRINHSVAVLYFTDVINNKINIPSTIVVYTYDYQNTNKKVVHNSIKQEYMLCWTDDYTIELNKNVLINIKNQRKWNIIS